jgi:hypothetical protein
MGIVFAGVSYRIVYSPLRQKKSHELRKSRKMRDHHTPTVTGFGGLRVKKL